MPEDQKQKEINDLKEYIAVTENSLRSAKKALADLSGEPEIPSAPQALGGKIIEGTFNGENMIGPDGKVFPVPANYASKSKLVEGDRLKLTIAEDGSFIFKQIGPVPRKKLVGNLVFEENAYYASAEGKKFHVLNASVSYYKANPGDRISVIVPQDQESKWAVIDNVIVEDAPNQVDPEENIFSEEMAGNPFGLDASPKFDTIKKQEGVVQAATLPQAPAPQVEPAPVPATNPGAVMPNPQVAGATPETDELNI